MLKHAVLKQELEAVNYQLSPHSMKYLPEYNQRVKVLERLGYVNEQGFLEMKGRVACLFSEHELLLTELLLCNALRYACRISHYAQTNHITDRVTLAALCPKKRLQRLCQASSFSRRSAMRNRS